MLPPTKARVSRFAENPPPLADVLSGDMQCDFYERPRGRKATSQKQNVQNNPRIFNGSNISNISSVSNRYSGYIGNQMLFGWVTQVALSLGIHLAVAGGSRPTLYFLGPSPGRPPCSLHQGRSISRAARTTQRYPHQALKGGYFLFVFGCGELGS